MKRETKLEVSMLIGEARYILGEIERTDKERLEIAKSQLEVSKEIRDLLKNGNPSK